jgi:hypothetical protein
MSNPRSDPPEQEELTMADADGQENEEEIEEDGRDVYYFDKNDHNRAARLDREARLKGRRGANYIGIEVTDPANVIYHKREPSFIGGLPEHSTFLSCGVIWHRRQMHYTCSSFEPGFCHVWPVSSASASKLEPKKSTTEDQSPTTVTDSKPEPTKDGPTKTNGPRISMDPPIERGTEQPATPPPSTKPKPPPEDSTLSPPTPEEKKKKASKHNDETINEVDNEDDDESGNSPILNLLSTPGVELFFKSKNNKKTRIVVTKATNSPKRRKVEPKDEPEEEPKSIFDLVPNISVATRQKVLDLNGKAHHSQGLVRNFFKNNVEPMEAMVQNVSRKSFRHLTTSMKIGNFEPVFNTAVSHLRKGTEEERRETARLYFLIWAREYKITNATALRRFADKVKNTVGVNRAYGNGRK